VIWTNDVITGDLTAVTEVRTQVGAIRVEHTNRIRLTPKRNKRLPKVLQRYRVLSLKILTPTNLIPAAWDNSGRKHSSSELDMIHFFLQLTLLP
jgi:hypothetical protein